MSDLGPDVLNPLGWFRFPNDSEHWHHDTFVARWSKRYLDADALVTFALGSDGRIREVRMAPVSPSTDASFDFRDLLLTPSGAK